MNTPPATPRLGWTEISRNPISADVEAYLLENLSTAYKGRFASYRDVIEKFTKNKTVLDIGVVEHSREFIERPQWKHRIISQHAKRAVGCDILEFEVEYIRQLGFDIHLVDATSESDLGERFELVYIGDVIEHVPNAVQLMQFATRHLEEDGNIVVTTPCPFWYRNIAKLLSNKSLSPNADHICWITPANALEIGRRANLRLENYYLVQNLGHDGFSRALHRLRTAIGLGDSELFAWGYVYVFSCQPTNK